MTRLTDAAEDGRIKEVKEFIQAGDDINGTDEVYQMMILSSTSIKHFFAYIIVKPSIHIQICLYVHLFDMFVCMYVSMHEYKLTYIVDSLCLLTR